MKKTAFLFPGQGSQCVGMGADLYREYDSVREIFDMADEVAREHISRLCFKGPIEELTQTNNLQPAVTAVNLSVLNVLTKEGAGFDYTAGHSLGEYSALAAAGVASTEDVLKIVRCRGELMHGEAERFKGAMSAVIGLGIETVTEISEKINAQAASEMEGVYVANHNAENQIVVSGTPLAVKAFSVHAKEAGGRAIPLKVSGAWHSRLISGAEEAFGEFLDGFHFIPTAEKVLFNVTAEPATSSDEIRNNLVNQLCSPVKWHDTMMRLVDEEVEIIVEIGPGKVLSGLAKKSVPKDSDIRIFNVCDMRSLEVFLKEAL